MNIQRKNSAHHFRMQSECEQTLEGSKAELPLYLSKAGSVSTEMIKLQWWQSHEEELQCLQAGGFDTAVFSCSFCLLTNSFNERQNSS